MIDEGFVLWVRGSWQESTKMGNAEETARDSQEESTLGVQRCSLILDLKEQRMVVGRCERKRSPEARLSLIASRLEALGCVG